MVDYIEKGANRVTIFKQDDHIILPNATLKRFADEKTKKISYLKLSNPDKLILNSHFPKSFHTKPGFYDPQYDAIVKRYETLMGNWYKIITVAIKTNNESNIDQLKLKKDIIEIINIQYQRMLLADETLLNKFIQQEKKRYEQESEYLFKFGKITKKFLR